MGRPKAVLGCSECGYRTAQWAGRCAACGAWGTISAIPQGALQAGPARGSAGVVALHGPEEPERRVPTGFPGIDRVLGGGLVPASVVLLAGEPGIGKSTLLLQLMARMSAAGLACCYASGEESRAQVAARGRRLGLDVQGIGFVPGRELPDVIEAVRAERPALVAVDSIQTLRDPESSSLPGGPSQVRLCTDALVGLAKTEGVTVLLTGHVTKDGDLAGPRTLEHAVDVVLSFEGESRSGLRLLAGGKNRFGQEGEIAWFEMGAEGPRARPTPPNTWRPGAASRGPRWPSRWPAGGRWRSRCRRWRSRRRGRPGGRRPGSIRGGSRWWRRCSTSRSGWGSGRSELYGATAGGLRVDDPACDLAVAAALASSATGRPPPAGSAFVGEVALTGQVRPAPGLAQRLSAARAAGIRTVFAPRTGSQRRGVRRGGRGRPTRPRRARVGGRVLGPRAAGGGGRGRMKPPVTGLRAVARCGSPDRRRARSADGPRPKMYL